MIYFPDKTVPASIDCGADWEPTLAKLGDKTIVVSSWDLLQGSVLIDGQSIDPGGKGTAVRISGGVAGTASVLRNTVTLNDGSIETEDALIKVI